MTIKLFEHQKLAVDKLRTGSILFGGVGSGKSLTSIFYYYTKECAGGIDEEGNFSDMKDPKDLFIITTAQKRDTLDWERECANFMISTKRSASANGVKLTVDSWNNISKYTNVEKSFFIFDEQRVVGSGSWVRSFKQITKKNSWILLSATPGDTWMDYIPVFVANGFYKHKTDFIEQHVIWNSWSKFPKVDRYIAEGKLQRLKEQITVEMPFDKPAVGHHIDIIVPYDKDLFETVYVQRWNPYRDEPIKEVGELFHLMRKVVNSDLSRLEEIKKLIAKFDKLIVFYNFDYELDILRRLATIPDLAYAEYNGHKHQGIPNAHSWVYVVHYMSGAEGWNCIETNAIAFYSQHYSYRLMTQAAGRIDRLNTTFTDLYYYHIRSISLIDNAIVKALKSKKDFNENKFLKGEE